MSKTLLRQIPLLVCVALFVAHLVVVLNHAVNVPFLDEWHLLDEGALPAGLSPGWLFAQHNEHRIVPTKILTWVLLQLDGWNIITSQIVNYFLYGLLLLFVVLFARKFTPQLPTWSVLCFVVFLLSPLNHENHAWSFQSQFHFAVLFFLVAINFLFDSRQSGVTLLLGITAAVLAIYSFSSGVISCGVLLLLFTGFKLMRALRAPHHTERKRELVQLGLVALPLALALGLWFVGYEKPQHHPPLALPTTPSFWRYFFNLVALGFGLEWRSQRWGVVCLLLLLLPLAGEIWKTKGQPSNRMWAVGTAILGLLGALAVISIGRAGFGIYQPYFSRYTQFGLLLLVLGVLAWAVFLRDSPKLLVRVTIGLWIFFFVALADNWSQFGVYERMAAQRERGLRCIENYYAQGGDGLCTDLHPAPLAAQLERARAMNVSFYRDAVNAKGELPGGASSTHQREVVDE